ncbi:hypothetical protein J6590_035465 [Homalodisca vitripennis]|nr:hypothetical protein J6590_035465 [Homalodisca vitripennis]
MLTEVSVCLSPDTITVYYLRKQNLQSRSCSSLFPCNAPSRHANALQMPPCCHVPPSDEGMMAQDRCLIMIVLSHQVYIDNRLQPSRYFKNC